MCFLRFKYDFTNDDEVGNLNHYLLFADAVGSIRAVNPTANNTLRIIMDSTILVKIFLLNCYVIPHIPTIVVVMV